MSALVALALTQGLVAAFNPCGFAMLPAYLSYFVGAEADEETNVARNVMRGLVVGLTLTAGFVLFFTTIGILSSTLISEGAVEQHIPKVTLTAGILMIPLGIAMAFGVEPKLIFSKIKGGISAVGKAILIGPPIGRAWSGLKRRLPKINKGGSSDSLGSIFGFGISYAAVSLSCTAPLFFGTVIGSFTTRNAFEGTLAFLAYAVGMGLVVIFLTLAMALARNEVATFFRKFLPYVQKVSGLILIGVGIFLVFYGWWEIQVLDDPLGVETNAAVDLSNRLQGTITNWITDVGGVRFGFGVAFILAAILVLALRSAMRESVARLALPALAGVWLFLELVPSLRYEEGTGLFGGGSNSFAWPVFDFLLLGVVNTIISLPQRFANWFLNPLRWETLGEVVLTFIVGGIIWLRLRQRAQASGQVATTASGGTVSARPETTTVS